jgi:hypothetical protein
VFGKSAEELNTIAQNASVNIFDRGYRPYSASGQGLPYIMPGDFIKYNADDTTAGYVFERTLKGLQALQDEYEAQGTEEQVQSFGPQNEIIQMKGRATKIEKSVDGLRIDVEDMDKRLSTEIDVLAGQIVLKVNSDGRIGYIELNADPDTELTSIKLKADDISLEGLVTVNGNFKVLIDGTIEAVNGKFSGILTSSEFVGGAIRSQNYYSGVSGMMIDLYNGTIDSPNFYVDTEGKIHATGGEFSGAIHGSEIDSTRIISSGNGSTLEINNGFAELTNPNGRSLLFPEYIRLFFGTEKNIDISYTGAIRCKSLDIDGEGPITPSNFDLFLAANIYNHVYPPVSHSHPEYASTYALSALQTWALQTFQPKA